MKNINTLIALTCLALLTAACGESSSDESLPEGTAPNEAPAERTANEPAQPKPDAVEPETPKRTEPAATEPDEAADTSETADTAATDDDAERSSIPGLTYVLPEGWTVGPAKQMRLLTLIPEGQDGAELAISRWPGDVGGFAMNVQRWARQAGLPPIPDLMTAAASDFEKFTIDGHTATWIPLMNEDANTAILAVWVPLGEDPENPDTTWTFKLTCKAEQVQKLAPDVRAWCESVRFKE